MSILSQAAMLVIYSAGKWQPRKFDKRASHDIAERARTEGALGNERNMGRYNKILMTKHAFGKVDRLYGRMRNYHYAQTMPFLDSGARVLVNTMFNQYDDNMQRMMIESQQAVDAALVDWDYWVDEARQRLGPMFNAEDYPSREVVRSRFYADVNYSPMPEAGHWISKIEGPVLERLKRQTEQREREAIATVMRDVWRRLFDAVDHVVERLDGFAVDPRKGVVRDKIFKDSLITNLRDLIAIMPDLNITHDPDIDRMTRKVARSLAVYEPDQLRKDPIVRAQVVAAAQSAKSEIAEAMKAVF